MDYCSAQPPRSFRQNALHGFKQLVDLEGLYNLCGRVSNIFLNKNLLLRQKRARDLFIVKFILKFNHWSISGGYPGGFDKL